MNYRGSGKSVLSFLAAALLAFFVWQYALAAWTDPSTSAPGGNIAPPINISSSNQTKSGNLSVGTGLSYWITKSGDSFALNNNAGATKLVVGQDGNVGIGTTGPNTSFVLSNTSPNQMNITDNLSDWGLIVGKNTSSYAQSGYHGPNWAHIINFDAAPLVFGTNNSEDVIIDASGNVGIGTTSPGGMLDIVKTHSSNTTQEMFRTAFDANWGLRLVQNYVGAGDIKYELKEKYGGVEYDVLSFKAGNVGIGTASPANQLYISGSQGILNLGANGWGVDPGTTGASIVADNNGYKALMIVGNNISGNSGKGREVKVWDFLNVQGQVKITGGTPGAGKVLTSDAAGLATWVTPAAGATYSTLSGIPVRTAWSGIHRGFVAEQLSWKNYGNGHTIFDASNGTSPDGGAVNNTNSQTVWSATYPTLMGWNGSNTYGVRVDSARLADNATLAGGLAVATGRNNVANQIARTDANGYLQTGYINSSNGDEGNNSSPARVWGTNGSDSYLRTYLTSALTVGNATLAGGLAIATGRNNLANQIVRTDASGYLQTGYIDSIGGLSASGGKAAFTRDGVGECCGNDATIALGEATSSTGRKASISFHNSGVHEGTFELVASGERRFVMRDNQGSLMGLEATGNIRGQAFYYTSDGTLKKDVSPISNSLEKVEKLNGVYFKWKNNDEPSIGLIAQDVEKVFPEAVSTNSDTGLKSVDYGKLVAPLIEAVKTQQTKIEVLEAEVEKLKSQDNEAD